MQFSDDKQLAHIVPPMLDFVKLRVIALVGKPPVAPSGDVFGGFGAFHAPYGLATAGLRARVRWGVDGSCKRKGPP